MKTKEEPVSRMLLSPRIFYTEEQATFPGWPMTTIRVAKRYELRSSFAFISHGKGTVKHWDVFLTIV
jgi:hypothetical protein